MQEAGMLVKPGITTDEIDQAVHDMIVAAGAYPSPLNYGKFPKSVCTSVNEVMCHGIPDKRWAAAAGLTGRGCGGCCSVAARGHTLRQQAALLKHQHLLFACILV